MPKRGIHTGKLGQEAKAVATHHQVGNLAIAVHIGTEDAVDTGKLRIVRGNFLMVNFPLPSFTAYAGRLHS